MQYSLNIRVNKSKGIVEMAAAGFDFSPKRPIIVICMRTTDKRI